MLSIDCEAYNKKITNIFVCVYLIKNFFPRGWRERLARLARISNFKHEQCNGGTFTGSN